MRTLKVVKRRSSIKTIQPVVKPVDFDLYLETEELKTLRDEARKKGFTLTEYIKSLVRVVSLGKSNFRSLG